MPWSPCGCLPLHLEGASSGTRKRAAWLQARCTLLREDGVPILKRSRCRPGSADRAQPGHADVLPPLPGARGGHLHRSSAGRAVQRGTQALHHVRCPLVLGLPEPSPSLLLNHQGGLFASLTSSVWRLCQPFMSATRAAFRLRVPAAHSPLCAAKRLHVPLRVCIQLAVLAHLQCSMWTSWVDVLATCTGSWSSLHLLSQLCQLAAGLLPACAGRASCAASGRAGPPRWRAPVPCLEAALRLVRHC